METLTESFTDFVLVGQLVGEMSFTLAYDGDIETTMGSMSVAGQDKCLGAECRRWQSEWVFFPIQFSSAFCGGHLAQILLTFVPPFSSSRSAR